MKKTFVLLFVLAMTLAGAAQAPESQTPSNKGLFSGRDKYLRIEAKLGRAFLQAGGETGEAAQVFYGGAGIGFGVMLNNTMVGIGGAFECVDLMDKSYSFPLFVEVRHCIPVGPSQGVFLGVKGGWILGGERSFPTEKTVDGQVLMGTTVRSLKGPYGEVMVGYRFRQFDFFVAYNFRLVKYQTSYFDPQANTLNSEPWKKNLHVVMGGVGFRLF